MKRGTGKKGWISEQLCVPMARTCNLYCRYCQSPPRGEPAAPLNRLLEEVRRRRVNAVSLEGGGEPTASGDFFDWIAALKKAGVGHFMLSTNAVALSDPGFARKAEREIDYFTVNLPAADEKTYAHATRSVKFGLAMKGLENLKALGAEARIRLFHIIYRGNYRRLPAFADWTAGKLPGLAFVNFTFVRNAGRVRDDAEIIPRYPEVEPYLKLALGKLKRKGIRAVTQNFPLCRLRHFEGFSFEFHRWRRGDRVLEAGIAGKARCSACSRCTLGPACCGARADYLRVHGRGELETSALDPAVIRPEPFQ
ncbi:MAG: radical SAM protein [Elusimicrobiales bacterium]|nr:radical SAM protein [Elusimicrobiales bacterium]